MRKESIDEMERIRRGLEEYLETEVYDEDWDSKEWREAAKADRKAAKENDNIANEYEEFVEFEEDWDSPSRRAREVREMSGIKQNNTNQENEQKDRKMQKQATKNKKRAKKKKSRLKRFLVKLAVVLVLLALGINYLAGLVYDKMNYQEIESVVSEPLKENGVVNILLIGNDSRSNGEDGRSDAMILLSISSNTKKIYMTSLLRDMYVDIPGHDGNRLNAAYAYGGAELLMETVETNLDIEVNHYMLVNFEAFVNLVDLVGGVELELSKEEMEYVNGYLVEYNMLTGKEQGTDNLEITEGGLVHLNGAQALAYSRNRYLGTDFGRTERQRKVLTEVIQKLPKTLISNPKGVIDGLMHNLTTNLTKSDCIALVAEAAKLAVYDLEQLSIPVEGSYQNANIRGMAVLEVDFEANKEYLHTAIYGEK